MRVCSSVACILTFFGCSTEESTPPSPADGCAPHELALPDGSCRVAGVPPEACAVGFTPDGAGGCEPLLPAEACAAGWMAVPGETVCRPVAPCAPGRWGDIPVNDATVFVDASYLAPDADGSAERPFPTIGEALAVASDMVALADGTYQESVIIDRTIKLWGRCPERVHVIGDAAEIVAILVRAGGGTELRDLSVSGQRTGIGVTASGGVLLHRVWVHDTLESHGIDAVSGASPVTVTVQDSLVEGASGVGVFLAGTEAMMERSVVRRTRPTAGAGNSGVSVQMSSATKQPSHAVLRGSLIEENQELGVQVWGSELELEASAVRGTLPLADGRFGRGVIMQQDPASGLLARASLRASVIAENHEMGVFAAGAEVSLEHVTVRDTLVSPAVGYGRGIALQAHQTTQAPTTATVRASKIAHSHELGLFAAGADIVVEALWVDDVQPVAGRSRGILAQSTSIARGSARIDGSLVERSQEVGIAALDVDTAIGTTVVRNTMTATGAFGDGIVVDAIDPATSVSLSFVRLERNARAGLLLFEGHTTLSGSRLSCNAFDLDVEGGALIDGGENHCGCNEAVPCKALTSGIEPPAPLEPAQ